MPSKARELKTRIRLDGEAEYKKQLGDISSRMRTLSSDLNVCATRMKTQGESAEDLRAQQSALCEQYVLQQDRLKILTEMLEKSNAKYGEGSRESEKLKTQINNTTVTMLNLENSLDECDAALRKYDGATKTSTQSSGKLGTALKAVGSTLGGAVVAGAKAAAAALAAVGAAAAAGATHMWELSGQGASGLAQLGAQTGAAGEELEELGTIAQQVYRDNFGGGLDEVSADLATVRQNTGLMGDALKDAVENGYRLQDTFGMDQVESSRAAAAMMEKFGISAEEAYNLIAVGAQNGANQNGDLLDVISEYAPHYAAMGLSADQMMQTLINGAEGGVFQIDKVGDAMKEFSIRAIDGSETTKDAFQQLGLDAKGMASAIAAGGPTAEAAFQQVVAALMSIEDPLARNQAAVALFGTQYEDLGAAALPILAGITDTSATAVDALGQINDVKYNTFEAALEGVKRQVEGEFLPLANAARTAATHVVAEISSALSDGFQPEDVQLIGQTISTNLMSGIQQLSTLMNENMGFVTDAMTMIVNTATAALPPLLETLLPAAMGLLQSVLDGLMANVEPLTGLATTLVTSLAGFLITNAPALATTAADLLAGLTDGITAALPTLLTSAADMVTQIVTGLLAALPSLLDAGLEVIGSLVSGITGALPTLIEAVPQIITTIVDTLTTSLPDVLAKGGEILLELVNGILGALPKLLEAGPKIIAGIIDTLTTSLPDILAKGGEILKNLISGIVGAIPDLIAALPAVVDSIKDTITGMDCVQMGKDLLLGLVNGLETAAKSLLERIKAVFSGIWQSILDVFGIASPSTEAASAAGFILDGLLAGFTSAVDAVCESVKKIFGKIWDAIKSIFGFGSESEESKEAKQAGKDIMTGMQEGIAGDEEKLKEKIRSVATNALATFRSEFGIDEGASTSTKLKTYGQAIVQGICEGIEEKAVSGFQGKAYNAAHYCAQAFNTEMGISGYGFSASGAASKFAYIGTSICDGIAGGIETGSSRVSAAARAMAQSAYNAAKSTLGIHSPSTKFAYLADMSMEGYTGRLGVRMGDVRRSVQAMNSALHSSQPRSQLAGAYGAAIDYTALARAMKAEGLGTVILQVDGKELGRSVEPGVSVAQYRRSANTVSGRGGRLVIA